MLQRNENVIEFLQGDNTNLVGTIIGFTKKIARINQDGSTKKFIRFIYCIF